MAVIEGLALAALRAAITGVKSFYKKLKGRETKKEFRRLVTDCIAELVRLDPDVDAAEARLRAAQAMGIPPRQIPCAP